MAQVYVLPGIERRDLLDPIPSEQVLHQAIENGVVDAIVIGRSRDGTLYVASAVGDADRDVGLMMRAVHHLTSCTIVNDQVIEPEEVS